MYDPAEVITVTFCGRTFRASRHTAAHLQWTIEQLKTSHPACDLIIWQTCYNTGVAASAGTHDKDAVLDVQIAGMGWWDAQHWLRAHGWAGWFRHTGQWADSSQWHIHMISLGYPGGAAAVGVYVPGQVADYYNHALGLAGQHVSGEDTSWFPPDINATIYREDWFDMATKDDLKAAIREVLNENSITPPANDSTFSSGKVSLVAALKRTWRLGRDTYDNSLKG